MQQKRQAKMAREARHFVDEAFFVPFCAVLRNFRFVTLSVKNSTYFFELFDTFDVNSRRKKRLQPFESLKKICFPKLCSDQKYGLI